MKILAAAIKLEDGTIDSIQPPNRHSDLLECIDKEFLNNHVLGFLDSERNFLTRKEAYPIAQAAGQLLPADRPGHTATPGTLYTEDMW